MLMTKPQDLDGKVAAIKLITGEEIIARVKQVEDDRSIQVTRPLSMVMMSGDQDAQGVVAFAPWMLGINDNQPVRIESTKIMFAAEAREDAAVQYSTAVGEPAEAQPKVRAASATPVMAAARARR